MRKYSFTNYPNEFDEYFNFLITDFGFSLTQKKETDFSYINEFQKENIRVRFNYDIRDNFFYFSIIRGKNTLYPNDHDQENIKPLFSLFEKYEPNLNIRDLLPDDTQYIKSLELNAKLLKKYGEKVLNGEEWI